jgi:dTDP-glucose 4,6-dehydratase
VNEQLAQDLDEIIEVSADDLRRFGGARLYVTGGTGFIGTWLVRAIMHANRRLALRVTLDVLTRDPPGFATSAPDIAAADEVRFLRGDVLAPPHEGPYDAVIHAATPASAALNRERPDLMFATILDGTRAVLRDVVAPNGTIPVLFMSSGAVYGAQPPNMLRRREDSVDGPDPLLSSSAYAEGKRAAELMMALAQRDGIGSAKIARLFAFLGPGLPLHAHYAAGNFVADALSGGPINILGDGTDVRSYLYPTDLASWCFAILARGVDGRAYNIGSDDPLTIESLAKRIAQLSGVQRLDIAHAARPHVDAHRYVPDTSRATEELSVRRTVEIDDAILRTLAYYRLTMAEHSTGG